MVDAHLLVMCHGMWGNITHFDYIVQQLKVRGAVSHDSGPFHADMLLPAPKHHDLPMVVYRTHSNEGYFTYDGIDVCGTRVSDEICAEVKVLKDAGVRVAKLSLMGYSMGGLMVRYAAGVLYTRQIFDTIEPGTFTTFYSPHVGVNVLGSRASSRVFNYIGSWSMARTSQQVFLRDIYQKSGTPLFLHMTDSDSPYIKSLKLFTKRVLYANVHNDRRCEYYTASIEAADPFEGRARLIEGPYADRFGPIVLESTNSPQFREAGPTERPKPTKWFYRVFRLVATAFKASIIIPSWFVAFLINAGYQAVVSSVRTAGMLRQNAHVPEYEFTAMDNFLDHEANGIVEEMYDAVGAPDDDSDAKSLELTPVMRLIIERLNTAVTWEKHPVHITADKNAHSAAIMRNPKQESFWEGKYVVKHWLETVLGFEPDWTPRANA